MIVDKLWKIQRFRFNPHTPFTGLTGLISIHSIFPCFPQPLRYYTQGVKQLIHNYTAAYNKYLLSK